MSSVADHGDSRSLRDAIERQTIGQPANRACLPGSDAKWEGYQLGVEEAIVAAEEALRDE